MKFFSYFKDGAILQQNAPVKVWGKADGEVVCTLVGGEISFTKKTTSVDGKFSVTFDSVSDTRSNFTLTATCGEEKISASVRFGDVYLAMGQSNMSYSLSATEEWQGWLERAKKLPISFLYIEERLVNEAGELIRPAYPQEEFSDDFSWTTGGNERLGGISAICVQTATLLSEKQGIPVGFVQTAMGGLSVETYAPRAAVEENEKLVANLKAVGRYVSIEDFNQVGGRNFTQLGGVYNEKIAPLIGLSFKGIVWYLGESSAYNVELAEGFFMAMQIIRREYAKLFGKTPFIAIHIAPEYYSYGDKYGYLYVNEQIDRLQSEEIITLPIYDVEPRWQNADGALYYHPIHPVNKAPISERVAAALTGERTYYPQIERIDFTEGSAFCHIKNVGEGLAQGKYNGFTLAGEDGKYYPAQAISEGKDCIRVTSIDVKAPKKLTYAFQQYQDFCNAKTVKGAPVLPYRSVIEPVTDSYYFPPAYTVNGGLEVYENNFGWQIGDCRKVKTWKDGSMYNGAKATVTACGEEICIEAEPTAKDYFLFGVSPAVCLCGHKNHLADFKYLNISLRAESEKEVLCLGMVFRTSNGEIYRFDLLNGEKKVESIPVKADAEAYTMSLTNAITGDSGPFEVAEDMRKNIVEAELLFRAFAKAKVYMKDVLLSDTSLAKERAEEKKEPEEIRLDAQLPTN